MTVLLAVFAAAAATGYAAAAWLVWQMLDTPELSRGEQKFFALFWPLLFFGALRQKVAASEEAAMPDMRPQHS